MENRDRDCDKTSKEKTQKTFSKTSYNNRKANIKKKTMELATLCGADACTIIYGPDGAVDSWPENQAEVMAVINKLKGMMDDPNNRKTVKDESVRRVVAEPKGKEIQTCLKNSTAAKAKTINFLTDFPRTMMPDKPQKKVLAVPDGETNNSRLTIPRASLHLGPPSSKDYRMDFLKQSMTIPRFTDPRDSKTNSSLANPTDTERLMKFIEKSSVHLGKSSGKSYQKELLNQLNSTLESLTKRTQTSNTLELLTTSNKSETDIISLKKRQANCSEATGQKRTRINQAPPFLFDLNLPPPDESAPSSPEDDNQVDTCEQ